MSLPNRVQSVEHQIGLLNQKLDRMQNMLEEYFGVRRGGQDHQDPVLQTYVKMRSYLQAEKTCQQELTSLLRHVEHHNTAAVLKLFYEQLPEEEKPLFEKFERNFPTLSNYIRESTLWNELEEVKKQLLELSQGKNAEKSLQGNEPQEEPSAAEEDIEMSTLEAKEQPQVLKKVLKRKPAEAPQVVSQPKLKKPSKRVLPTFKEDTPLESLLRSAGVHFQKAKLSEAQHRLAIAKQLPDRDLTKEQLDLIYKKLEEF